MSNINFQHLERLTEALSKDLNSPGKNVSGKTLRIARDLFGNRDAWEAKQLKSHRDLLDDTKKQNIQALGLDLILKANREQDKPILRGILKVCNLFPKVFYSRNWKTTKETKISLGKALYLLGGGGVFNISGRPRNSFRFASLRSHGRCSKGDFRRCRC